MLDPLIVMVEGAKTIKDALSNGKTGEVLLRTIADLLSNKVESIPGFDPVILQQLIEQGKIQVMRKRVDDLTKRAEDILSRQQASRKHNSASRQGDDGIIEIPGRASSAPSGVSGCKDGLKSFTNLQKEITSGNLPPETRSNTNIEFAGCEPKDRKEIPPGWIKCQCPGAHPSYGYVIDGARWHDPQFPCPK